MVGQDEEIKNKTIVDMTLNTPDLLDDVYDEDEKIEMRDQIKGMEKTISHLEDRLADADKEKRKVLFQFFIMGVFGTLLSSILTLCGFKVYYYFKYN